MKLKFSRETAFHSLFWKSIEVAANSNPQTNFPAENGGRRERNLSREEFAALESVGRSVSQVYVQNKLRLAWKSVERERGVNRCLLFLERENRNRGRNMEWGYFAMAGESENST